MAGDSSRSAKTSARPAQRIEELLRYRWQTSREAGSGSPIATEFVASPGAAALAAEPVGIPLVRPGSLHSLRWHAFRWRALHLFRLSAYRPLRDQARNA